MSRGIETIVGVELSRSSEDIDAIAFATDNRQLICNQGSISETKLVTLMSIK